MKHILYTLSTCLLLFCHSSTFGQLPEFTWQPGPLTELDIVIPVKDGWLWAVGGLKMGYSPSYLQKRSPTGELVWESDIPPQNGSFLSALVELPDHRIMAIFTLNFCDHWVGPSYMLIDSDGKFLQYKDIDNTSFLTYKLISFVQQTDTILLAWKKDFNTSSPDPNSLTRWDISTGTEYIYPIQSDGQDHPVALKFDLDGNILIGLDSGGFGTFDPETETVFDTLASDFGPVYDVAFQPDGSFFTCGNEKLAFYNAQGIVLQQLDLPNEVITTGFTTNGNLIAFSTNQSTSENRIFILDSNLDTVSIIENLSDDAELTQLVHVNDQLWALGQEHQNVFAKSFSSSGFLPILNQDAELLEISFESSLDTITPWFTPNCKATFKLENVKIHILNNGSLPLHQVAVNWDLFIPSPLWHGCEYTLRQLFVDSLNIAPGQSEWINIPDIELYTYMECGTIKTIDHDFCIELTCPNQMIDADHVNDFSCTTLEFLISSQKDPTDSEIFSTYPNPFVDQITLVNIPKGASSITIFDILGRIVLRKSIQQTQDVLQIPSIPTGFYSLLLQDNQGRNVGFNRIIRLAEY